MTQEPKTAPQQAETQEATAPGESSQAQEMFLGKLNVTDGKSLSFCQWTVVGAGDRWTYSAIMPLSTGGNHHILMGHDAVGGFLREAQSDTKEEAMEAVRARIMAFLKKQPRWRLIK